MSGERESGEGKTNTCLDIEVKSQEKTKGRYFYCVELKAEMYIASNFPTITVFKYPAEHDKHFYDSFLNKASYETRLVLVSLSHLG